MKLYKVRSLALKEALKDKKLFMLRSYLDSYMRDEEGHFVCRDNNGAPDIRLSLEDYLFNEQEESETLWAITEKVNGKKKIDLAIVNTVDI